MNNSLALPRLQRLHNSQSIRMRGAILQITLNNNLPPGAQLPSLKQIFSLHFFFSPSASSIPEVHCLISPQHCLPPRGRVDLLIGSCDQTYGRTKHRPQLHEDKSRLVWGFPLCLAVSRSRAVAPSMRTAPTARWRKLPGNASSIAIWRTVSGQSYSFIHPISFSVILQMYLFIYILNCRSFSLYSPNAILH